MKLAFDPDQPHQRAAIDAVLDVVAPEMDASGGEVEWTDGGRLIANRWAVARDELDARARAVQQRAGLPSTGVRWLEGEVHTPHLAVDMETGTGKTYTLIRTALELSQRSGLRKFVVVVPSVAIREGILKTFQATRDHFRRWLPGINYRFFAYDGRLEPTVRFAQSSDVEFVVLTIDAFNKSVNLIRKPHDRCGGLSPLGLWQAVRPVLLLDEPHHLETSLREQALDLLRPCLAIRYGATHRSLEGIVHRLSPLEAYQRGLVKRIEVRGIPVTDDRELRFSRQLEATLELHADRQARWEDRGIKVLSLIFVDRVEDVLAEDGVVRRLFDAHYERLRHRVPLWRELPAEAVRAAYFATDRRGRVCERVRSDEAASRAYRLILRDKERLLSLEEPVAFVLSHSVLREGWDNPNVFQICPLARSRSAVRRRQEIGRGIRLSVDQSGNRVRDPEVDVLSVIANEAYETFVAALQTDAAPWLDVQLRRPATQATRVSRAGSGRRWDSSPSDALIAALRREVETLVVPASPRNRAVDVSPVDMVLHALGRSGRWWSRNRVLTVLEAVPRSVLSENPHEVAVRIARLIQQVDGDF